MKTMQCKEYVLKQLDLVMNKGDFYDLYDFGDKLGEGATSVVRICTRKNKSNTKEANSDVI